MDHVDQVEERLARTIELLQCLRHDLSDMGVWVHGEPPRFMCGKVEDSIDEMANLGNQMPPNARRYVEELIKGRQAPLICAMRSNYPHVPRKNATALESIFTHEGTREVLIEYVSHALYVKRMEKGDICPHYLCEVLTRINREKVRLIEDEGTESLASEPFVHALDVLYHAVQEMLTLFLSAKIMSSERYPWK